MTSVNGLPGLVDRHLDIAPTGSRGGERIGLPLHAHRRGWRALDVARVGGDLLGGSSNTVEGRALDVARRLTGGKRGEITEELDELGRNDALACVELEDAILEDLSAPGHARRTLHLWQDPTRAGEDGLPEPCPRRRLEGLKLSVRVLGERLIVGDRRRSVVDHAIDQRVEELT